LKIKNLKISGDPDDLIFWKEYEEVGSLPDVKSNKYSDRYNVRLSPLKIDMVVNNSSMSYSFSKGYLFDHASSPKIFNWFIDHDAKWVTIAAYVHDSIFHHKTLSVDFAAELFYRIMRYSIKHSKMSFVKKVRCYLRARAMRIAVKTHIAEDLFKNSTDIDSYNRGKSSITINK
jgi:hypothetical protein